MKTLDSEVLDEIVRRIVAALQPKRIYLYGSHAYGQPYENSDVDLFIVTDHSLLPPHKRAVEVYRALRGLRVPIEVKVVTDAEFERRRHWISSLERIVEERGRILYESPGG